MKVAMSCYLICAIACAHQSSAPLAASMEVDPMAEIVAIPPGACLGLDDHFAMSTNAVRHMLVNQRAAETKHAVELEKCNGATRIAETQRDAAMVAAEHGEWWQRWGALLIASGLFAGAFAGGAVGFTLWRK
jgi:hypothetical protein